MGKGRQEDARSTRAQGELVTRLCFNTEGVFLVKGYNYLFDNSRF